MDPVSHTNVKLIRKEKKDLEMVAGVPIFGNRVHYTMNNDILHKNLQQLGFKYDSSAKFNREKIVAQDFGYFKKEKLIIFPITIMDALAFNYLVKKEDEVVNLVKTAIKMCQKLPRRERVMTILWHQCVLKMKKGRRYRGVLEFLTSQKNVEVKRGIDLVELIERGEL